MFFFVEKDVHLLQNNDILDAYLTSGSIKCIDKPRQLLFNTELMILFIYKCAFFVCLFSKHTNKARQRLITDKLGYVRVVCRLWPNILMN